MVAGSSVEPVPDFDEDRQAATEVAAIEFDVVTSPSQIEAEWRSLQALPRNSINQGYDWCSAWWAAHRLPPTVLRGRAGPRTVFLLPLEIVSRGGLRILRLPGERFNNLNTGLFSAAFPVLGGASSTGFATGITAALATQGDILFLEGMARRWSGEPTPLSELAGVENPNPSFQLPLHASMDETIAQLNAKTRRKRFRSQCRRLEALGGFEHYVPDALAEQHMLLDLFFEQKANRLGALGLPNVFHAPEVRRFFHDLIARSGTSGNYALKMHALRLKGNHEGRVVAVSGLSRQGDHVLCQFGSIDETLCPGASPGELLFWLMIEQACREGAKVFDFGVGDQPYKRSWCTETTVSQDILLPLTAKGRLALPLLQAMTRLRRAIKARPRLYGVVQRFRSLRR